MEGERVRLFPEVRPFVLNYINFRAGRVRQLDIDPAGVEPLFPNEKGGYYSEPGRRMALSADPFCLSRPRVPFPLSTRVA